MDDVFVTYDEATSALVRLRAAQHLSVERYRDIVFCLQYLFKNPNEVPDSPPAEPPPVPAEKPDLSAQITEIVAATIKKALAEQPECKACKQPLPEKKPEPKPALVPREQKAAPKAALVPREQKAAPKPAPKISLEESPPTKTEVAKKLDPLPTFADLAAAPAAPKDASA